MILKTYSHTPARENEANSPLMSLRNDNRLVIVTALSLSLRIRYFARFSRLDKSIPDANQSTTDIKSFADVGKALA